MNYQPAELLSSHKEEFQRYSELLLRWNQKINLTAITDPHLIWEFHFLDSLFLITQMVSRETVLDMGSGAGLPGLALKIVDPTLKITLIDSVKKKCDFMKEVVRTLSLKDVTVIHGRVTPEESIGQFDVVVSRAAFKMKDLIQMARPNLKSEGRLIAMKSGDVESEIQGIQGPIEKIEYTLPSSAQRKLLTVRFAAKCFT